MEDNSLLKAVGLKKSFNGIEVLHSVDLKLTAGKVTALLGENGAGKSTLMKILMGEYRPDKGEIFLDGEKVEFANPHQALAAGISMIFQEMSPFPNLTVYENMYIGREPHKGIFIQEKRMHEMAVRELASLGIELEANRRVSELTVSEMQLLEIAKAVSYHSKIIIMDEPTSALTSSETDILFDLIKRLKQKGVAIVYITHKLNELWQIADNISVLRDGSIVSAHTAEGVDQNTLISEMVGRKIENIYPNIDKQIGGVVLEVRGLERKNVFENINFKVRAGEIVGFAGMVGSGRTEVITSIFGVDAYQHGEIIYKGKRIDIKSPRDAIRNHFALIPEDRARDGLNLQGSVKSNICMTAIKKTSRLKGIFINPRLEDKCADEMIGKMGIKLNSKEQIVSSLSGGNQQKIVVAKWLLTYPDVIFLDEPTRGIDVGAKFEIYQLIQGLAKEGKAVVMISSEMPELLGICDKIVILKEGKIVGEVFAEEASQESIFSYIAKDNFERQED